MLTIPTDDAQTDDVSVTAPLSHYIVNRWSKAHPLKAMGMYKMYALTQPLFGSSRNAVLFVSGEKRCVTNQMTFTQIDQK